MFERKIKSKMPQPLKILAAAFKIYDMFDVKTSGSQPDIWVSQDDASDIRYATLMQIMLKRNASSATAELLFHF